MSEVNVSESVLRKVLQKFNEDYGISVNETDRRRLGKVLTVIDAAIPDPEQRKAVKDLIQNDWWTGDHGPGAFYVHQEIRNVAEALGFDLYPESENAFPKEAKFNRYENLTK